MIAFFAAVAALATLAYVVKKEDERCFRSHSEVLNKWERMTGKPCQPHDRTGLPTSPPPPRRTAK